MKAKSSVVMTGILVMICGGAEARFLSVDPVKTDQRDGANFNRYWYANNNPYLYTDPDGRAPKGCGDGSCEGVMISGPLEFRKGVRANLEAVRAADPENARRISTLEGSRFAHRIVPHSREPEAGGRPANRSNGGPDEHGNIQPDGSRGPGVGSVTAYDPNQTVSGGIEGSGTPASIIAHEVAGHAYDRDQGQLDTSVNPITLERKSEESAKAVEYRHIEGAKKSK